MKIVVLSDLGWEAHLKTITQRELLGFNLDSLSKLRYASILKYYEIILDEGAELVIFAGDVTGDGSCGHGYHFAFIILLSLLEYKGIQSYFINGNHDEEGYFQTVVEYTKNFKYTEEISGRIVSYNGLKFYGINFFETLSKTKIKKHLKEVGEEPIDILVAHSTLKRRIRLFDFNTKYIFTGHFDRKLLAHKSTAFVALDNDFSDISYATLQIGDLGESEIAIKVRTTDKTSLSFEENVSSLLKGERNSMLKVNGNPTFDLAKIETASVKKNSGEGNGQYLFLKYLRGINYKKSLVTMDKLKQDIPLSETDIPLLKLKGLPIISTYKISESMIEDYLGNVV